MDYEMDLEMKLNQAIETMKRRLEQLQADNMDKKAINADGTAYIYYDGELRKCYCSSIHACLVEGENIKKRRLRHRSEFVEE